MFSVPFNYATDKIAFSLAIVVQTTAERVFDNIIQDSESPELKVAKCGFHVLQGTLMLEHTSLVIKAIHVAKMNVVIETKAS